MRPPDNPATEQKKGGVCVIFAVLTTVLTKGCWFNWGRKEYGTHKAEGLTLSRDFTDTMPADIF
jgi:hypothetical protein